MGVVHVRRDCILCYIIIMALSLCSQIFIIVQNFKLTKSKFRIMPKMQS